MKIGMITDSLPGTDFDTLNLDRMLESEGERRNFKAHLAAHGIAISALNCSGNPLHPGESGPPTRIPAI